MPLNIKNSEVEQLAEEIARLANESKTEAIRRALLERRARLRLSHPGFSRADRLQALLENRIWPSLPAGVRGTTITKAEEEEILGFGTDGF